jgi:hypothetical protein
MIELHRIGNDIGLYDGERCFIIPFEQLDSFDDAFFKMKRQIERSHNKMVGMVVAGGVTHNDRALEVQIAEIELKNKIT